MTDTLEHKTGELVLRIRGTSREGQLLRLRSRKCTIGSGPHCTLRLSAKGVAPLHCLILRGQGGTIVRRWASGTRLNGQPFTDAELTPGDRLKIGPLEFEIVALNEGVEVAGADSPKDRAAAPVPLEEDSQKEERQSLDVFKESLQAEKAAFDLRVFQINQEVVALEKEKESLNQEKTALIKEREAFEESQKKFYAEQSIAIQEQKSMQANREALLDEQKLLDASRDALLEEQKTLQANQDAFLEEQKAWQAERTAILEEQRVFVVERDAFLEKQKAAQAIQDTLSDDQGTLQAERDALQNERSTLGAAQEAFAEAQKAFQAESEAYYAAQKTFLAERDDYCESQKAFQAERDVFLEEQKTWQAGREALSEEQQALNADRNAFSEEQKAFNADRDAFQLERESLSFEKNCFEVERQNWKAEQEQLRNRQEAALAAKSAEELHELQRRQEELELQGHAFEEQTTQFQADCEAAERRFLDRSRQLDDRAESINAEAASLASLKEQSEASASEMARERQELDEQKGDIEARAEQLKQMAADNQSRTEHLDLQAAELDRRSADLDVRLAALNNQHTELDRRIEAFTATTAELEGKAEETNNARSRMEAQAADLEQRMVDFAHQCEKWEEQRRSREDEIVRREQEFALREQSQVAQISEFQQKVSDFLQDKEAFLKDKEIFQKERELFQKEQANEQEHKDEIDRFAAVKSVKSECRQETPRSSQESNHSEKGTVDLHEILRRLGHNAELPEDDAAEAQSTSADSEKSGGSPLAAHEADTPVSRSRPESAEEDESIDSYMAQLMQRLGVKQDTANRAPATIPEPTAPSLPIPNNAATETPVAPEPRQESIWQRREPVEISPRAVAPENHVNLSAFRDLANLSAAHALGRHDFNRRLRETRSKLIVCTVSLIVGCLLFWHSHAHSANRLTFIASVLSFLIALIWGLQYAVLTGSLIVNRSGQIALRNDHSEQKPNDENHEVNLESRELNRADEELSDSTPRSEDNAEPT